MRGNTQVDKTQHQMIWTPHLVFSGTVFSGIGAHLIRPRHDRIVVKNMIWNVHAVLVIPDFTRVTLCHFVSPHLGLAAEAVKVYGLSPLYTSTPLLTYNRKA